jgi:ribosomal protein S18 acetylase RimI-like enzyme
MSFVEETDISFQIANHSQSEELSRLVNSAYRGESSRTGWTTEADFLGGQRTDSEKIRELISEPNSVVLLAIGKEKILGCVNLQKIKSEAYLGMLTIDPKLQACGLGRRLMIQAENLVLEKWMAISISMTVLTLRAELIAWYERRGYVRTGKYEPFPYGDIRFGIPKRDDLRFEVLRKIL